MITTLLKTTPYIDLPYHWIGWLGWLVLAVCIGWSLRKKILNDGTRQFWMIFLILVALTILTSLFFGIRFNIKHGLPLPNITRDASTPVWMIFSALPWMLAGGMLGYWPAVALGLLAGSITALWNTHNLFTPLETVILAMVTTFCFRQNYRTRLFIWLRRPIGAAGAAMLAAVPLFFVTTFFSTNGSLAARLDYAFTQSWTVILVNSLCCLLAGLILEFTWVTKSKYWIQHKSFVFSPYETDLQARVFYIALPLVIVLLLTLAIADWVAAGKTAEKMLENRLKDSASISVEAVPALLDTGRSLLADMVTGSIPMDAPTAAQDFLKSRIRAVPFFTQFYLFDLTGAPISAYPEPEANGFALSAEEQTGVSLALNGVTIQSYVIQPEAGSNSARISYIASIPDEYGLSRGVIIAHTDLLVNSFARPAIQVLDEINAEGGEGVILDAENRIIYHTNPNLVMSTYQGDVPHISGYFKEPGGMGSRRMVYASVSETGEWKVLLSMPASTTQDMALQIAVPLLAISSFISIAAYFLLRYMVKSLAKSLVRLSNQADEISQGRLEKKIGIVGVDEIGRLSMTFEKMRSSLKSRLEELDVLLNVTTGIASDFEINKTAAHLLKACLSYGASSARLILRDAAVFGFDEDVISFSAGRDADEFAELDTLLLNELGDEKVMVIPSKARMQHLGAIKSPQLPSALVAMALTDDAKHYGMLWIAYTEPHRFHDEEIHFLNTIAGQAVLAISNSSLFMNAEVGKRRLESVLASTPEPVLVVSESGKLLVSNHAAENVNGLIASGSLAGPNSATVLSTEFLQFLDQNRDKANQKGEVKIQGKTYEVSVSPVLVEHTFMGTVCVLRDITEYREIEKMKSDFVTTVSHDLRAPMGIVRGYASMLQLVGEMNEQQKEYSAKIINDLAVIDQMVEKLLDLGRIESGSVLQLEKVSPMALFDNVVNVLQPLATQRKVQIMRELTIAQNLEIEADRVLLHQALYNLMENAIKFSPLGGQVALRLQASPEAVVFEIQDHGPGIAPLDIDKIFDKFNRSGLTETPLSKGPGLGLSIVKSIAERHHGRAWAKSILGKGSTFFLQIPIKQGAS